jgi:hypothetical protein
MKVSFFVSCLVHRITCVVSDSSSIRSTSFTSSISCNSSLLDTFTPRLFDVRNELEDDELRFDVFGEVEELVSRIFVVSSKTENIAF